MGFHTAPAPPSFHSRPESRENPRPGPQPGYEERGEAEPALAFFH